MRYSFFSPHIHTLDCIPLIGLSYYQKISWLFGEIVWSSWELTWTRQFSIPHSTWCCLSFLFSFWYQVLFTCDGHPSVQNITIISLLDKIPLFSKLVIRSKPIVDSRASPTGIQSPFILVYAEVIFEAWETLERYLALFIAPDQSFSPACICSSAYFQPFVETFNISVIHIFSFQMDYCGTIHYLKNKMRQNN